METTTEHLARMHEANPDEGGNSPLSRALQNRRINTENIRPKHQFDKRPPPDHNPLTIPDDGTEASKFARQHLGALFDAHSKMLDTAMAVGEEGLPALAKSLEPEVKRASERAAKALTQIDERIRMANEELGKSVGGHTAGPAQEVRDFVRGLPQAEQLTLVRDRLANYDNAFFRAVLSVEPWLLKMSPEVYGIAKQQGELLLNTDAVRQRDAATFARTKMDAALQHFNTTMKRNIASWAKDNTAARINSLIADLNKKEGE